MLIILNYLLLRLLVNNKSCKTGILINCSNQIYFLLRGNISILGNQLAGFQQLCNFERHFYMQIINKIFSLLILVLEINYY